MTMQRRHTLRVARGQGGEAEEEEATEGGEEDGSEGEAEEEMGGESGST